MKLLSKEDRVQVALGIKHICPQCNKNAVVTTGWVGVFFGDKKICKECDDLYMVRHKTE